MSHVEGIANPLLRGNGLYTIIQDTPGRRGLKLKTTSKNDRILTSAFREIASMCDRINITTEIKVTFIKLFMLIS